MARRAGKEDKLKKTKAPVAYFAAKLVEVASDNNRFEAAFVDTDLGGSSISIERGLEDLYIDGDELMGTKSSEADEAWSDAYTAFYEAIADDAVLEASVNKFNATEDEVLWAGRGPLPVQRRLVILARKLLAGLYPMPKFKRPDEE